MAKFKDIIARAKRDPSEFCNLLYAAKEARGPEDAPVAFDTAIEDYVSKHGELSAEQTAAVRHAMALLSDPSMVPLSEAVALYLKEVRDTITADALRAKRRAVDGFLKWAGDVDVRTLTRALAGKYLTDVLVPAGRAPKTTKDVVTALATFGNWAEQRGMLTANPWRGLARTVPADKRGLAPSRRPWTHRELQTMAEGATGQVWQLFVLLVYSGCRLEEVCKLRLEHVHETHFEVTAGKSQAALRAIPWHPVVQPLAMHLAGTSGDGYLLEGLPIVGPDHKRGHSIAAQFARRKKRLGLLDPAIPLHTLRNSFAQALLASECPEELAQFLLGHRPRSLSYGLYAQSPPLELLAGRIQQVNYGEADASVTDGIRKLTGENR